MSGRTKSPDDTATPGESPSRGAAMIEYLERTLPRHPGDVLRITHIPGTSSYRANWYDSRAAGASAVVGLSIAYIRKSRFLHCSIDADGTPRITYPQRQ